MVLNPYPGTSFSHHTPEQRRHPRPAASTQHIRTDGLALGSKIRTNGGHATWDTCGSVAYTLQTWLFPINIACAKTFSVNDKKITLKGSLESPLPAAWIQMTLFLTRNG